MMKPPREPPHSVFVHHTRSLLAVAVLAVSLRPALADNPPITVNVDATANVHAIDSRIYGASWASATEITALGLTLNRWGGNAMSRYNWIYSTANRCKDYFFFNIPDSVAGDGSNGESADAFIGLTRGAGAQPVMTIPMLSLLPKDRTERCSFPQSDFPTQEVFSNPAWEPIVCGNGRSPDGNGIDGDGPRIITVPDPSNISTTYPASHQGDWVQHMINTWGAAPAGMRYYSLDNEPSLWSFDHWDVHPAGATYDEVWGKMEEFGALIRGKDAGAILTGPEEWGWSGYFMSGKDQEDNGNADRLAHANTAYIDWLLQQAKSYQEAHGVRILDVLTVHFYPQSGEFFSGDVSPAMQNLRNRSTRSLWDSAYVDESWIGGTGIDGGKVRLIPRLKEWVNNQYPGTMIGITEYNWGVDDHINGGTTQADILGIFGREGLDIGVRWGTPAAGSYAGNAFKMYRNYNGAGARFGETSVSASGPNPDNVSTFAGLRASDGALTIMLIAKVLAGNTPATVNIAGFAPGQSIQRWQLDSNNAITQLASLALNGSSIALTLPAQSVTLLVVPATPLPPAPTLTATATSTALVALTWSAVAGAVNYAVERSFNHSAFTPLVTINATGYNDGDVVADTTYLYRVRAILAAGSTAFSAIDPATTVVFADSPLTAGTPVKVVHFTQMRTAVNAMRAAAGRTAYDFTDALSNAVKIKAIHMNELRMALDQARSDIGLTPMVYTDTPIAANSTLIQATHVIQIRNGVK